MRFDDASKVEEIVWNMRLADQPRGDDRATLQKLYGGEPPFDEALAEENGVEINRNDLEGVNMLAQARRQWNQAFLPAGNFDTVKLDGGPAHKRREWSHAVTRHYNRALKRARTYTDHTRGTGANTMIFGIAPSVWDTRKVVVPTTLPVASLMIPSETLIDFTNLPYFAVFREWTATELYELTHGPRVDPGWNMDLVKSQLEWVGEQTSKAANATAFQYMPERIEELIKQDKGYWGSDAAPTVDTWDFYFRECEDGKGWYRRIILDWGTGEYRGNDTAKPDNKSGGKFLYDSKARKHAQNLSEILHCQFGDCSAYAPFKYHSVRSLGWMLWGVCDLQNRLHCKFNEAVFEQLMWFFRAANNNDLMRLKKANFTHLGVIPQGISFIPANERFKPDNELINMAFSRNRQIMAENAASFTQDFTRGETGKEMTATETMARVNSVNALVSGMLALAYNYEEFKDREIARRLCIKNNSDPLAYKFRKDCLRDGVPAEMLDADRWDITRERALGGGNKTLEMAQIQFLQTIRKNLNPDAQRRVDHLSVESATDDAALAEELAPLEGQKQISNSMNEAQLATERLLRGLPFIPPPDMVIEDYVKVWLMDLTLLVQKNLQASGRATGDQIAGYMNMAQAIGGLLKVMGKDPEEKPKVRQYGEQLKRVVNQVKAFAQRLKQAQGAGQNGAGGVDPETVTKLQGKLMIDQAKAQNLRESHAMRTAQKQAQFELEEARKDRQANADIRRENAMTRQELMRDHLKALQEMVDAPAPEPETPTTESE